MTERPGPVHSDAPDDKTPSEKWKFWFTQPSGVVVTAWVNDESVEVNEGQQDGILMVWDDKECTKEALVNLNHVYFAQQVDG